MESERARGHGDFLERAVSMLREEGFVGQPSAEEPVVNFQHPEQLQKLLSLDLGDAVHDEDELLAQARDLVRYSVRTAHPHFHNQLFSGADPFAVAGAWITEALNTSQYTFEVGPTFTLTEHAVVEHVLKLIGFHDGDGIFTPGGSSSNMYGMVAARYHKFPQVKTDGVRSLPPLAIFTSDDSHYSVAKGAHWLGLGTRSVVHVPCDSAGRMLPDELRRLVAEARAEGVVPFMLNATAGTTVLGAVDPLHQLADLCQELGLWMHVDACWGGTLILSESLKSRLRGLERAHSVAWNPHKMLGAPLQCSIFLIREKGLLHKCNSAAATYLFQQDKFYDVSWDTGDKSVQCGRKVDAFKLWLMWKARGDKGLGMLVDNAYECSRYFLSRVKASEGFRLVCEETDCTNVCFWYIPPSLRGQQEAEEWWHKVDKVAPAVKARLVLAGALLIGYCPLRHRGLVNFFRMVTTCHPPPTHADMDYVLQQIHLHGKDL